MDLNSLQLDNRKKILAGVFALLLIFVDVGYIFKAQLKGLKNLDRKVKRLSGELTALNQGLESMRLSKSKPGLIGEKKAKKSPRLLKENRVSELIQEISSAANKFDIKIIQIRPSRQEQKDKAAAGKNKLSTLLINLDLVSDYHNLGRFLQVLENSPVFMEISEMEISTQFPNYLKQKVSLVLRTYVSK